MQLARIIVCGTLLLAAAQTVEAETGTQNYSEYAQGTRQLISPEAELHLQEIGDSDNAVTAGRTTIVYLNRNGGVLSYGKNDDSSNNVSSLVPEGKDWPASTMSEGDWAQILSCVESQFSAFNVQVTDVDPGTSAHVEALISGTPDLLNQSSGVAGIAPFSKTCILIPKAVVYVFPNTLGNDPQLICEVTAQEVAHTFGLDHVVLCEDPMSYKQNCGDKTFQDISSRCGEYEARDCVSTVFNQEWDCNRSEQNSVQLLTERLGLADDSTGTPGGAVDPGDVIGGCSTGGTKTGLSCLLLGLGVCLYRLRRRPFCP